MFDSSSICGWLEEVKAPTVPEYTNKVSGRLAAALRATAKGCPYDRIPMIRWCTALPHPVKLDERSRLRGTNPVIAGRTAAPALLPLGERSNTSTSRGRRALYLRGYSATDG